MIDCVIVTLFSVCFFVKASSEASSSKSMIIDEFIKMSFSEKLVIKFINEYGKDIFLSPFLFSK